MALTAHMAMAVTAEMAEKEPVWPMKMHKVAMVLQVEMVETHIAV